MAHHNAVRISVQQTAGVCVVIMWTINIHALGHVGDDGSLTRVRKDLMPYSDAH